MQGVFAMPAHPTRARIATLCQPNRFCRTVEDNRRLVFGLLDRVLSFQPDLVCLPETFPTISVPDEVSHAEPVPGPTIEAAAERARQHRCYIICPLFTRRDGVVYNSAVVIGRDGEIVGIYDKRRPVTTTSDYTLLERGVTPGDSDGLFDLDFGRIGIRICFDSGFPEDWAILAQGGAQLVFWPSAYHGGATLAAYALMHRFWVVTSVSAEQSRIIDPCGGMVAATDRLVNFVVRDINLDFAVCHYDFNWGIPERILAEYAGRVDIHSYWDSATFLIEPTDPAVTVDALMKDYGIETADHYYDRHRETREALLTRQAPLPQTAAHGPRPMYSK